MYADSDQIVEAVEKSSRTVVNIASVRIVRDNLLQVFPVEGMGSGIIVDSAGHILTNKHVVDNANKLKVSLTDGRSFYGKIVGSDSVTDLAIIKVNSENPLPLADLGNSNDLKTGQSVVAIGNPFGLNGGPAVTAGIISSLHRSIRTKTGVLELIQTDAAINPGNSGGPLINLNGEVVAINTANMPYAQGIGFAVPINTAKSILEDLINKGGVSRPWLGISTIHIDARLARYYGLYSDSGVLVAGVEPYSPADDAGIRKGDIIEEIDGQKVSDATEISLLILRKKVNDSVYLTINRYGRQHKVSVALDQRP